MSNLEKQTLEILLKYWVQHNRDHAVEFRKWAGKAKGFGVVVHDAVLEAAQQMDKANESLFRALESLKSQDIMR